MKKFLALLLALVLFPGCASLTAQSKPKEVITLHSRSFDEVIAEGYKQTGLSPIKQPGEVDSAYIFPTHSMLEEMDKFIRPRQHLDYVEESNDCDDICKEWCVLSHRWWVEETRGKIPVALATFVAYVQIEPGAFDGRAKGRGGHALGLLCDNEGVWWFVEPSTLWHVKAQEALFEGTITTDLIIW